MFKIFKSYLQDKQTTDHIYDLEIFSESILLLKKVNFEGILNQIKIDGMVNDHSSSCNS